MGRRSDATRMHVKSILYGFSRPFHLSVSWPTFADRNVDPCCEARLLHYACFALLFLKTKTRCLSPYCLWSRPMCDMKTIPGTHHGCETVNYASGITK